MRTAKNNHLCFNTFQKKTIFLKEINRPFVSFKQTNGHIYIYIYMYVKNLSVTCTDRQTEDVFNSMNVFNNLNNAAPTGSPLGPMGPSEVGYGQTENWSYANSYTT